MNRMALASVVAAWCGWISQPAWAAKPLVQFVEIHGSHGEIVVETGPLPDVKVFSDGETIDRQVSRAGDRVVVRESEGEDLRVVLPEGCNVEVLGDSADVKVTGRFVRLYVHTVSGEIHAAVQTEDLLIKTLSGDVELEGKATRGEVQTVSGEMTIHARMDDLRINTTSGDLRMRTDLPRQLEVRAVSGDCVLDGAMREETWMALRTVSGDIKIITKGAPGFRLIARTRSGDIRVRGGLEPLREAKSADVVLGNGKGRVEIQTMSGDVLVER